MGQVASYLAQQLHADVQVLQLRKLGTGSTGALTSGLLAPDDDAQRHFDEEALKTFSYGNPILVECLVDGQYRRYVLHTAAANQFDHQQRSDRAATILQRYDTFNLLPQHSRALDVGIVTRDHRWVSMAEGDEFFLMTEYVKGTPYARDLQRLRNSGEVTGVDLLRSRQLALYLANIHTVQGDDPTLYHRCIRNTLGSGEGIMGLVDSYQDARHHNNDGNDRWHAATLLDVHAPGGAAWFEEFEQQCIVWRWRLKAKPHRLAQVHGDFHPFNVLFERDGALHTVARSRGAWGEPADDVAAMAINYLFFSLQRSDTLSAPFEQLWNIFWNSYLSRRNDPELLTVIAPFFAWRALVLASPLWYNVADSVRLTLLTFARAVLQDEIFEPAMVRRYLEQNPAKGQQM
jgi:aminoglycoside phosphotransferase (APT) family kinase protein